MTRQFALAVAFVAALATPAACETLPGGVEFSEGAVAGSLTGVPGDPEEGAKIYASRSLGNCVACHAVSKLTEVQWQGNVGPSLDGAGSRWTEAQLRGIVANAKLTFEGTRMPAFYKTSGFIRPGDAFTAKPAPADYPPILNAQQIEDVVAFLMTLQD